MTLNFPSPATELLIVLVTFVVASFVFGPSLINFLNHPVETSPYESDFTAMPHYVKFHIYPEESDLHVALWASDNLPPTTGITDNKSEFDVALLSTVKYNLWISERKCSRYIIPTMDVYYVECEVKE